MFYSQFILAKKGPLGTIWIAAHLERKLRKNQVADTDIGVSVDSILFPEVPIALRLSSHLLLGVVRIYSRKVNYLFDDCSEALLKIKQAFRSTAVDLPPEESTAPYHSITLPETFDLDDFELPDNDILQGNFVDHHVSTREQITLQDTMEGVVYSTSQFGLDERFGDGDASQIGLDLDEVLLNDKVATLEHDDFGASPQMSHQNDEKKEEIDDLPTAAEVGEYAQGPSTPGLEEPNLFGTQMDQGNNEVDYHISADLISMEATQKELSGYQRENDVIDCSLQNNGNHFSSDLHHEDNDRDLVEMAGKREEQEHLACQVVMKDQDNLTPNDHCLTSLPLVDSSNKESPATLLPECEGGMINASDVHEKDEDLHDGVLMNNDPDPVSTPLDQTVTNCVVFAPLMNNENVASPVCSHITSDQEDLSCKLLSNMDGSRGPGSNGHWEDGNTLSKHEVLNDIEISKNEGQSCPFDDALVSNVISPLLSPGRPEVVVVEAQASQELKEAGALNHVSQEAVQPTESILRPCTSHLSQPSLSFIEGEKSHITDVSIPALCYQETIEPSVCKGTPDLGKTDMQLESQIFSDKVESINKSAATDMPEPEKLLSLAYQHDGEATNLLMTSTPDNQGASEGHTGAAGVKCISGKKRSLTESTLTVQSMDFVESYGGAQSKRTAESVPDDDDLLSSILVGRKSSVLKMKPSPAAPEIASMKRARSAPRTSALKRKVLMDDMMVLHGDTIRQQLTNTEDIRRIRKKAPCTGQEILMIQRQYLEEEIFHEPILTDLSTDLTILQNETFDLTGIKVCDSGLDSSCVEKINDQESYSRTNTEIHGVEGNNEPLAVQLQEDAEVQPTEVPVFSESHQLEVNLGSHDIDAHGHTNILSHVEELDSSQNVEMNNVGGNIAVSEAENCSVGPGHESSSLTEVFANDFAASLTLMDQTNDLVDSIHTNIVSTPNAQNSNTFPILEDEFVDDQSNRNGVVATEHSMETRTQVHTDGLEANDLYASLATGSKETDEFTDIQASFNGDLPLEDNGNSMLGQLNEDQIVASGMECDDKDARSGCLFIENAKVDCLQSEALGVDEKESSMKDEENPVFQEGGLQSTMCPEIIPSRSPFVDQNDENDMIANDTGFLNVGDDEIIDDDGDFQPCAEGSHLENSGWSSRTRAVAKYLQTLFDKEELHGRQDLHLDNLLVGKTRKEASRMFFETLVLKTRDYVHVEQTKPFGNINIKPRMKLMKSDF
ncbi:Sister chromatid cohesion 1 protein 4 [Spatholobus suberectus]|nr:Sister chromatid cohesion 1 protein 4 [Spatholobus suberectus]